MSDSLRLTRMRMYALIDSVEHDMRSMLERFVLTEMEASEVLGEFADKVHDRESRDQLGGGNVSPLDYLDFRDSHTLLLRYKGKLPLDLARELRDTVSLVEALTPIRNRVMHGRPLADTDVGIVESIGRQLETCYWRQLSDTEKLLRDDPLWEPMEAPSPSDYGFALHNLPLPDYDETGLVGRGQDVHKLIEMIKRKRENVVTITGEGGIGKTALALEVAYRLVDDPLVPFEAVLWTSLKTERLTTRGVEPIRKAVRSMLGATGDISNALAGDSALSFSELGSALEGINALLVIDNLETVNSSTFMEFYEQMPACVKMLITSRVGVGEVERRYSLSGLQQRDACALLSDLARVRSVEPLVRLRPDTKDEVVKRLRLSPLAIRWFVFAVESGRDPLALLRDQSELLEFCIKSVHDSLSESGRMVLQTLLALGRPATSDELVLFTGFEVDDISRSVKELTRGALVRLDAPRDAHGSFTVAISESAGQYLRSTHILNSSYIAQIAQRDEEFRIDEERRTSEARERLLAPAVVRVRTRSDGATAQLLRQALLTSQEGDYSSAYHLIEKARSLNPDFWEVDRVDAFLRATEGDYHTASQRYLRAYRQAEGENRGVVAHFMSGHYSRNLKDLDTARNFAREAHDLLGTPETACALGNILVWAREFDEGIALIEPAIGAVSGKAKLIFTTTLISAYRRRAEYQAKEERSPLAALDSSLKGLSIALPLLRNGTTDGRSLDAAADCLLEALEAIESAVHHGIEWPRQVVDLAAVAPYAKRLIGRRRGPYITAVLQRLVLYTNVPAELMHLTEIAGSAATWPEPDSGSRMPASTVGSTGPIPVQRPSSSIEGPLTGTILSLVTGYGFIEHPEFPKNVFFHHSACQGIIFEDLRAGLRVEFGVSYPDGRPRADYVRPAAPEPGSSGAPSGNESTE